MDGGDIVGLVAVVLIFGGGTLTFFIKSMVRIAEIKAQANTGNTNSANTELLKVVGDLRSEVTNLRETSTRFDMSFDAAITRLEGRLERVEARQDLTVGYVASPENTTASVQTVGATGR